MWTGVWESPKLADGTNRDSDIELDTGANLRDNVPAPTWMVSTPDSFTKNDIQSDLANLTALYTSATERATLLEYTDSTGNATSVEVPKITFDDGSRGYAYWVADEGVKTRIDRPHKDASLWDATGGIPISQIGPPEAPTAVKQAIARLDNRLHELFETGAHRRHLPTAAQVSRHPNPDMWKLN
jgi:hypothetical protein